MTLTTEEQLERRKLVGFCNNCDEWYKFIDDPNNRDSRNCPHCGGNPSSKVGFQITTQRSFNPKAKRMTKSQIKKMGSLGA